MYTSQAPDKHRRPAEEGERRGSQMVRQLHRIEKTAGSNPARASRFLLYVNGRLLVAFPHGPDRID